MHLKIPWGGGGLENLERYIFGIQSTPEIPNPEVMLLRREGVGGSIFGRGDSRAYSIPSCAIFRTNSSEPVTPISWGKYVVEKMHPFVAIFSRVRSVLEKSSRKHLNNMQIWRASPATPKVRSEDVPGDGVFFRAVFI